MEERIKELEDFLIQFLKTDPTSEAYTDLLIKGQLLTLTPEERKEKVITKAMSKLSLEEARVLGYENYWHLAANK